MTRSGDRRAGLGRQPRRATRSDIGSHDPRLCRTGTAHPGSTVSGPGRALQPGDRAFSVRPLPPTGVGDRRRRSRGLRRSGAARCFPPACAIRPPALGRPNRRSIGLQRATCAIYAWRRADWSLRSYARLVPQARHLRAGGWLPGTPCAVPVSRLAGHRHEPDGRPVSVDLDDEALIVFTQRDDQHAAGRRPLAGLTGGRTDGFRRRRGHAAASGCSPTS